jgi:hypothetical protein
VEDAAKNALESCCIAFGCGHHRIVDFDPCGVAD